MKFVLSLTERQMTGKIPVFNENNQLQFLIAGHLDQINRTLYLQHLDRQEIGRLYRESNHLMTTYTVDVVNHSLVHVKRLNNHFLNAFFITRLNYWINGSLKKGSYCFRSGLKEVAQVTTEVTSHGLSLVCHIQRPEDVPFILLISVLFTQWHVKPLEFPLLTPDFSLSADPETF